MGWPLSLRQVFGNNPSGNASFYMQRTYDRGGHVLTQTYPSGHTVTYNFDVAGRLNDKDGSNLAFSGNLGDGVPRTYLSALSYDEASRLNAISSGEGCPR